MVCYTDGKFITEMLNAFGDSQGNCGAILKWDTLKCVIRSMSDTWIFIGQELYELFESMSVFKLT